MNSNVNLTLLRPVRQFSNTRTINQQDFEVLPSITMFLNGKELNPEPAIHDALGTSQTGSCNWIEKLSLNFVEFRWNWIRWIEIEFWYWYNDWLVISEFLRTLGRSMAKQINFYYTYDSFFLLSVMYSLGPRYTFSGHSGWPHPKTAQPQG